MPRQDLIQVRRGSRAAFNALTSGSKLEAGELGAATDTQELLVGLGPTVDPFVVANGGVHYFNRVDTGLDGSSIQTYAYIGGDQTGNALGQSALDIQSFRSAATQVASGLGGVAVGWSNTAGSDIPESNNAVCLGIMNTVLREGIAIGSYNNVNNLYGSALACGWGNTINDNSVAVGATINSTTGFNAVLLGRGITHTGTPSINEGSVLVGYGITASGEYIFGFGNSLTLTGNYSFVAGWVCNNSGTGSTVVGVMITNSGSSSICIGGGDNSGNSSVCIGNVTNTIASTLNLQNGSARLRGYSTGQLALSVQDRATAYDHTAAVEGSEPANTLRPGMFAIRRNGLEFRLDYNDAGVVRSVSLGTVV